MFERKKRQWTICRGGAASAKSNSAPNQSNSSEIHLRSERQTKPISAKWFGMAGKITLRKLQRKLKQRSLSPRLSGGARSTSNRQTVYFQSITLPCTNTCENRHTTTCANTNMKTYICKYKYKFEIWLSFVSLAYHQEGTLPVIRWVFIFSLMRSSLRSPPLTFSSLLLPSF